MNWKWVGICLMVVALSGCVYRWVGILPKRKGSMYESRLIDKRQQRDEIRKIGFTLFDGMRGISLISAEVEPLFISTFGIYLGRYQVDKVALINQELPVRQRDAASIAAICRGDSLDGLIVSRVRLLRGQYAIEGYNRNRSEAEVEMFLYSESGKLLLKVKNNTLYGNRYGMPPLLEAAVADGTAGAIGMIAKGMKWRKKKEDNLDLIHDEDPMYRR